MTQPKCSQKILDKKIAELVKTEAELLVTNCPACIVQLASGLKNYTEKDRIELLHIVDF
ncbi:MAG: heterodisulfide reductase-related iron-sulfur binding cluster [Bacillota bacterium]